MHDLVEHREDTCMVISKHDHIRTQGRHVYGHIRACMASLEHREDMCMSYQSMTSLEHREYGSIQKQERDLRRIKPTKVLFQPHSELQEPWE